MIHQSWYFTFKNRQSDQWLIRMSIFTQKPTFKKLFAKFHEKKLEADGWLITIQLSANFCAKFRKKNYILMNDGWIIHQYRIFLRLGTTFYHVLVLGTTFRLVTNPALSRSRGKIIPESAGSRDGTPRWTHAPKVDVVQRTCSTNTVKIFLFTELCSPLFFPPSLVPSQNSNTAKVLLGVDCDTNHQI